MSVTVIQQQCSSFLGHNSFLSPKLCLTMCSEQRRRSSSFGSGRRDSDPQCVDWASCSKPSDTSHNVTQLVSQALAEGRLVFGIYNCTEALQSNDGSVMACFVPDDSHDGDGPDLFMLLIRASCEDRGIPMIRTNRKRCLERFFENQSTLFERHSEGLVSLNAPDLSCFMIQNRAKGEIDENELAWITSLTDEAKKDKDMPFISFVG